MRKAFTLIELLVVIAIIAILAAILFPVFAQAKTAAKVTATISGVKQIALGLHMYAADFDDVVVHDYGTDYLATDTWVGDIYPYVKSKEIFFDKTLPDIQGDNIPDPFFPGYVYKWQWVTNLSLNVDGYSRHWGGTGCTNIDWGVPSQQRTMTSFEDPAQRLAVAPTRYAGLRWSWMRFYAVDASWPTMDRYASDWSWYQLIWDARRQYPGPKFPGAYADGHAAKFGKEKFIAYYADNPSQSEATTYNQYCQKMDQKDLWKFWGRPWSGD